MTDKTIRFNVDSREVQDYQSKLREQAQRMAVDMVSYARSQSTSAKETLQLIEEQIRAIEKRNRLDREIAISSAQEQLRSGKLSRQDYGKALQSIDTQTSEGSIQLRLLRELIEVTRQTSRDEIRSNRESAEAFARESFSENELENLRQLQTREQLDREKSPAATGNVSRFPGAGGQLFTSLATGNLGGIASGLLAILGAGGVAAALGAIAINTTRQYEQEVQSYAVANQIPVNDLLASGAVRRMRDAGLGLSGTEMMQKVASLMRSYGGQLSSSDGSISGILGAGISRGISDQALNQLMSISRFSGTPVTGTIGNIEEYLNRMGRPLIRLPELLDIYLQKSNEILQRGGVLYAEGLQQTMMSLSSSYGVEGFNLSRMMNALGSAAGPQSSNPIMEALKLQTLQDLYPNMNQWERFGQMEHALSNPDYLKALISRVRSMGSVGGESYQKFAVANLLGLGFEDVNRLFEGDFNIENIDRKGKTTQERNEEFSQKYESAGRDMVGSLSQLISQAGVLKDLMVEGVANTAEFVKNSKEFFEESRVFQREVSNALRDFK